MTDWEQVGRDAFAAGEPAAPACNAEVVAALTGRPVGDPETLTIMRGFSDGWMAANLAAPVEGVTT